MVHSGFAQHGPGFKTEPLAAPADVDRRQSERSRIPSHVLSSLFLTFHAPPQTITEDGFCSVFQTNALSSFVLMTQLAPLMCKARHARIVNVASDTGIDARNPGPNPNPKRKLKIELNFSLGIPTVHCYADNANFIVGLPIIVKDAPSVDSEASPSPNWGSPAQNSTVRVRHPNTSR